MNKYQSDRMRTGIAPSMTITSGGTASNPIVYDGHGDLIDGGVYLDENDWSYLGENIWTTAKDSFPKHYGYHPGWYKCANNNTYCSTQVKRELQDNNYLDGINVYGDVRVVPFNYDGNNPKMQGDAVWDSATNSVHMYSVCNPVRTYGIIIIPGATSIIGIHVDHADHLRFKNYRIIHCYQDAFRCDGGSDVEVSNIETAYTGGGIFVPQMNRPGDAITFNMGRVESVNDVRATKCKVYQAYDGGISFQDWSTRKTTIDNVEFDNNFIKYSNTGIEHIIFDATQQHTYTNAIIRDNDAYEIGYQMSTYASDKSGCRYHSHTGANPYTLKNAGVAVGSTLSASVYNNTADRYAGVLPGLWATTGQGIHLPYGDASVTIIREENNVLINGTDDRKRWIADGEVCFDPYVDGFPSFQ